MGRDTVSNPTKVWRVEWIWLTGNPSATGNLTYKVACSEFRRWRNNPAVKRVALIEETTIRRKVKEAKPQHS
jgi:hypothetical protein